MATKEAELRKTIDTQTGEIDELRKSNRRLKEELVNRVGVGTQLIPGTRLAEQVTKSARSKR
jgi:hypothetical protein